MIQKSNNEKKVQANTGSNYEYTTEEYSDRSISREYRMEYPEFQGDNATKFPSFLQDKVIQMGHPELKKHSDLKADKLLALLTQANSLQFCFHRNRTLETVLTEIKFVGIFGGFDYSRWPLFISEVTRNSKTSELINCLTNSPSIQIIHSEKKKWTINSVEGVTRSIGTVKKSRYFNTLTLKYKSSDSKNKLSLSFRKPISKSNLFSCITHTRRPSLSNLSFSTTVKGQWWFKLLRNDQSPAIDQIKVELMLASTVSIDDMIGLMCLCQTMAIVLQCY